jgi:hypothetical protein
VQIDLRAQVTDPARMVSGNRADGDRQILGLRIGDL